MKKKTKPTDNPTNGTDPEEIMNFVKRIENLQADLDDIAALAKENAAPVREDMASVRREAHDAGIGKKEFAALIRKRRYELKANHAGDSLDLAQRANLEAMLESLDRLAEQLGPIGEAARDHARASA